WLRSILANVLAGAHRRFLQEEKRNLARERSLQDTLDGSSAQLEGWLAADQESPSEQAMKNEELVRLYAVLAGMPDDELHALRLGHVEGCALADIAQRLNRSRAGVAGLLRRGLARLRGELPPDS